MLARDAVRNVPGTVMVDAAYRQSEDRMEQHMDLTTAEPPSVVP